MLLHVYANEIYQTQLLNSKIPYKGEMSLTAK